MSLKTRLRVLVRGVRAGVVSFRLEVAGGAPVPATKRKRRSLPSKRVPSTSAVAPTPANSADLAELKSALHNLGYRGPDLLARVALGMPAGNFEARLRAALGGEA